MSNTTAVHAIKNLTDTTYGKQPEDNIYGTVQWSTKQNQRLYKCTLAITSTALEYKTFNWHSWMPRMAYIYCLNALTAKMLNRVAPKLYRH